MRPRIIASANEKRSTNSEAFVSIREGTSFSEQEALENSGRYADV